ncbi:hypothetical protein POV26_14725 [Aequorivita todarodis]|uniref:hypothetical protein n=1 Tax=Aequorivita todarodis TaxID=2036821 RepID=UPI0023503EB7|nr:hypothetical protein [Aequorivita todarodis]MDC8002299.1 hypothetical protein [Aequorivita todarodis]
MKKDNLIEETISTLSKLPKEKILALAEYASFLLAKYEEEQLQKGMETLMENSTSFDFLKEDSLTYTIEDIKEKY